MEIKITCACKTIRVEAEAFQFTGDRISYKEVHYPWASVDLEEDYCMACGEQYNYYIVRR